MVTTRIFDKICSTSVTNSEILNTVKSAKESSNGTDETVPSVAEVHHTLRSVQCYFDCHQNDDFCQTDVSQQFVDMFN